MTFDLQKYVSGILSETSEENLDIISMQVFSQLPSSAYAEALRQALPEVVRKALATATRAPKNSRLDQRTSDTQHEFIEPGQNSDGGEGHGDSDTQLRRTLPVVGQNLQNSRVAIFRRNRFRMSVWLGEKIYRPILDCTRADLEFAARESHRQADANLARAVQYERLTKAMAERGVDKVSDLTDAEIEAALSGEDAGDE